jgi:Transglutaminase-like superfamily
MASLVFQAYVQLIRFDCYLAHGNFRTLYEAVRSYPIGRLPTLPDPMGQLCHASDLACVWYRKHVLCLQRSAATTCLLKRHGIPAQMVIGAQQVPFKAHAWVEVDGRVVNDRPYMQEIYAVLDRC